MNILRICLTHIFCILAALVIVGIFRGTISVYAAPLFGLFFVSALGLNGDPRTLIRCVAMLTGILFSFVLIAPFFLTTNMQKDIILFVILVLIGSLGVLTLLCLLIPDRRVALKQVKKIET